MRFLKKLWFELRSLWKKPKPVDPKLLKEDVITICAELNALKMKLPGLAFELMKRIVAHAETYHLFGEVVSMDPTNGAPFVVKWSSGRETALELIGYHKPNEQMIPGLLMSAAAIKMWLHYGYDDLRSSKQYLDPDNTIVLVSISYYLRYPDRWPSYTFQKRSEAFRSMKKVTKNPKTIDRVTATISPHDDL